MKYIKNFLIETVFLTIAVIAWGALKIFRFSNSKFNNKQ